jgi:hypothetical protein
VVGGKAPPWLKKIYAASNPPLTGSNVIHLSLRRA